jgi:biopolymer transport protein ExbD
MDAMKYLALFLFITIACSTEKTANTIYVEINPGKLILNQETIKKEHFEKELKSIIEAKKTTGFKCEELVINLKVDERTRRGDIADIEVALRRLNVRRIVYSTFGKQAVALNRITSIHTPYLQSDGYTSLT